MHRLGRDQDDVDGVQLKEQNGNLFLLVKESMFSFLVLPKC